MTAVLGIAIEDGRVYAVLVSRRRVAWAAEAPFVAPGDLAQVLAALAGERPRGVRRARVALSPTHARVKAVDGLPPLAPADLAAHVRLHSRRYFVQNGIPLVTAAHRAGGPGDGAAVLAAAPLPLLEAVIAGLEAAGLVCETIAPAQALNGAAGMDLAARVATVSRHPLDLVPDAARVAMAAREARALRRWTAAAAAALLVLAASALGRMRADGQAAEQLLGALGPAAESALVVQRDLEITVAALADLRAAEGSGVGAARTLARLAQALSDSAFLSYVQLQEDGTVRLSGLAVSAARTLAQLDRAGFRGATLDGPVMREFAAGRERERFTIVVRHPPDGAP